MSNGDGVTYTVKELIGMLEEKLVDQMGDIQASLNEIRQKLDSKASEHRVDALEQLISLLSDRVRNLELSNAGRQGMSTASRWVVGVLAGLSSAGMAGLLYLISQIGGH